MTSIVAALLTLAAVGVSGAVAHHLLRRPPARSPQPPPPAPPAGIGRALEYRIEQWHQAVADTARGPGAAADRGWLPAQAAADYAEAEGRLRALVESSGSPASYRLVVGFPASWTPAAGAAVPFIDQAPPVEGPSPMTEQPPVPLFTRIGGTDALRAVVKDFYRRMVDDQRFTSRFVLVDMAQMMRHQVLVWTILTGGPNPAGYTAEQLHQWVGRAHQSMRLNDDDFAAMAVHLTDAAAACGVDLGNVQILGEALETFRPDVVSPVAPAS